MGLDNGEFFLKFWRAIAKPIKEMINSSNDKQTLEDETLDLNIVKDKLKVLGSEAAEIAELLGVVID